MRRAAGALLLFALSACAPRRASLPYFADATLTPRWLAARESAQVPAVGAFALTDQQGRTLRASDLAGRPWVASFVFTHCGGICPTVTANVKKAQRALGEGATFVSFSVDPERDTPDELSRYAAQNGLSGRWHLLTGERAAIYALARRSFFAESTAPGARTGEDFLHTENVYLVDGQGRIRGIYNGTLPLDVKRLVEDVNTLRAEEA